jgi:Na+-transporting methylmalonyl-CoA/oxaloacetate decarboxylase gamma subunit
VLTSWKTLDYAEAILWRADGYFINDGLDLLIMGVGIMDYSRVVLHDFFLVEFMQAVCPVVHRSFSRAVVLEELDFPFEEGVVVNVRPPLSEALGVKAVVSVLCSNSRDRLLVVEPLPE